MAGKKGDLEVTIVEARNLGIKGHALYCSVELKTQRNTTNARTYFTTATKDAKWNQTFNLDLMSLDGEELIVQIFCKRNVKKDKFLGQSQLRISALNLSKEAEWHYLTDRPETELKTSDTLKRSMSLSVVGNKNAGKKKDVYIISGEILYKLNFIHRLIRAKSKAAINKDGPRVQPLPLLSESASTHRLSIPSISPRSYHDFQASTAKAGERPVLRNSASNRTIQAPIYDNNAKEETSPPLNMQRSTPPEDSPVDMSINEEVIIDEALKEKQKIVKEKLEQGERLIRTMTSRIIKLETTEGEAAAREDKTKLEQIKKNMSELEKILESTTETEPANYTRPRSISHTTSARHIERVNDFRVGTDAKSSSTIGHGRAMLGRETSHTISSDRSPLASTPVPPSRTGSKWDSSTSASPARPNGLPRNQGGMLPTIPTAASSVSSASTKTPRPEAIKFDSDPTEFSNIAEEAKFLRVKVKFLEKNYETVQNANAQLEREVARLEKDLERYHREEKLREREERLREREERMVSWEKDYQSRSKLPPGAANGAMVEEDISLYEVPSEPMDEQTKEMQNKLKSLDAEIRKGTLRKNQLRTEAMKNAVRFKEETLRRINNQNQRLEAKANQKLADNDSDPGSMDNYESDLDSSVDDDTTDDDVNTSGSRKSPNMRSEGAQDAKFDALVAKLEKLDKLDELLRKLDNMKMVGGSGGGGDSGDGRSYAELKAELESIQAVIFDETGKYTEKEKEDANIKYEKVSQEFQQTPEYKAEVAAALEEKRRVNEPLNKAALEKMVKVYYAEAIRDDPIIKDKVQKNPELLLIGMDPKAILSKHQNDFAQYMLRNLSLDELRAIRASLPKFRNDQKRQIDWMESLEQKIEQVSKEPPKKPAAKKAPAIKIKTKPAGSGGGDFLAELMARQKREAAERGEVVEEEKKETKPVSALKLAPKAPPPSAPTPPPPSLMHTKPAGAPPPPPPPPRV
eukprot:Phypoly_transcript_01702.p1 GENE.Phypoly_transcript_01702~~Phypoly_transcript_01702.p1  ORF type:complete len:974 (+),score=211.05 Phypoly_transcript_01702:222-3143(+)